jgi:protein-S-isoprenylcysteine O-methyltransferase Ste14
MPGRVVWLRGRLARYRVHLGFLCGALAYVWARPTTTSMVVGALVALAGESVRVWASGHIEKGREVTRSGPYRLMRHPLYFGSTVMGAGFAVAAARVPSALVVAAYLCVTYIAAMRNEEVELARKFGREYAAYREGRSAPVDRAFSFARVIANREYRAVVGLVVVMALLWMRMRF